MKKEYQEGESIIGAHILVGLTYLDEQKEVKEKIQLHGSITEISESTIRFERADGKGNFSIPFEGELEQADFDAVYTLSSTGEAVKEVDFISSWTVHPPQKIEAKPAEIANT